MENLSQFVSLRGYTFVLGIAYCLLMYLLARKTKFQMPAVIYSVAAQVAFMVYYVVISMRLIGTSGAESRPLYNQLLSVVATASYCFSVPLLALIAYRIIGRTNFQRLSTIMKVITGVVVILLIALCAYVFSYIFVLTYYGFAP